MQTRPVEYFLIRGRTVWLDYDIAPILAIPTSHLNRVVTRHPDRFPASLTFLLDPSEIDWLRHTSHRAYFRLRFRPTPPRAFTREGIIMACSMLRSQPALDLTLRLLPT